MTNNILVSVLMTSYNREEFIAAAIESVLSSSYTNFELIICDDCSTDKTLSIARSYEVRDNRIRVFSNEVNLTQFGNRNKIASLAKGYFIKYIDSDDILYSFALQFMVEGMMQYPEATMGFCLTHGPCKLPLPYMIDSKAAFRQHFFEGGLLGVGPSGLIIKRSAFEEVNGFDEFGMPSDNHLSLKIASKYPVVAMTRDLFWWRLHEGQVFSLNIGNNKNILNNYNYVEDIIVHYSPLTVSENKVILFNQKKIFFSNLLRIIFKKYQLIEAIQIMKAFLKKDMSEKNITTSNY